MSRKIIVIMVCVFCLVNENSIGRINRIPSAIESISASDTTKHKFMYPAQYLLTADYNEKRQYTDPLKINEKYIDFEATAFFDEPVEEVKETSTIKPGVIYSKSDLLNFDYLLSNFFVVDSVTSLNGQRYKVEEYIDMDLSLTKNANEPQILIFHTHSQEAFLDSKKGEKSDTIVGVGEVLTKLLREKGYNVIHDTSCYDVINGVLDRSKAYTYANENIAKILKEHPTIEVVLDIHRDGVREDLRLVTEIDGKPTAQVMFFNGISYTNLNGEIEYLKNPNLDTNLAMSLQMQLLTKAYYPDWTRRMYIHAYRYCLHHRGRSMLVEVGAQNNTVEEVKNAMYPLADTLDRLLSGEKNVE